MPAQSSIQHRLHEAVYSGTLDEVKAALDNKACPNYRNLNLSSLDIAAMYGWDEIAKLLLENNAEVNNKGQFGMTALHRAARSGHYDVAKVLIDAGADLKVTDIYGKTPLRYATENGHSCLAKMLRDARDHHSPINNFRNAAEMIGLATATAIGTAVVAGFLIGASKSDQDILATVSSAAVIGTIAGKKMAERIVYSSSYAR